MSMNGCGQQPAQHRKPRPKSQFRSVMAEGELLDVIQNINTRPNTAIGCPVFAHALLKI